MSTYLADPITFLLILVHLHKYMLTICLHCLLNGIKKKNWRTEKSSYARYVLEIHYF